MNSIHRLEPTINMNEITANITQFFQPKNNQIAACDPMLENCGPLKFDTTVNVNPTSGNTYHPALPVPGILLLGSVIMELVGSSLLYAAKVLWVAPTWELCSYLFSGVGLGLYWFGQFEKWFGDNVNAQIKKWSFVALIANGIIGGTILFATVTYNSSQYGYLLSIFGFALSLTSGIDGIFGPGGFWLPPPPAPAPLP